MDELDEIMADVERDYLARVAELRAKGIEPRPLDVSTIVGCEPFRVSVRPLGEGRVGIDVSCGRHNGESVQIWGDDGPGPDLEVDASSLLKGLAAAWPTASRPFRRGAPVYEHGPMEEADWGALSGLPEIPTLKFVADGPGLMLEHANGTFDPEAECLIVVETLMTVGDLLAGWATDAEAVAVWRGVRDLADVFPFSPVGPPDYEARDVPGEQEFYARRLGTDVERWRGHMLERGIAGRTKWTPFPDDLTGAPSPAEETAKRIADFAKPFPISAAEFTEMLIREGVIDSRQRCFFAQWPGQPASSLAP